jgi:hypothetical protein
MKQNKCFFEKISNIYKTLANLAKGRKEKKQINKINKRRHHNKYK